MATIKDLPRELLDLLVTFCNVKWLDDISHILKFDKFNSSIFSNYSKSKIVILTNDLNFPNRSLTFLDHFDNLSLDVYTELPPEKKYDNYIFNINLRSELLPSLFEPITQIDHDCRFVINLYMIKSEYDMKSWDSDLERDFWNTFNNYILAKATGEPRQNGWNDNYPFNEINRYQSKKFEKRFLRYARYYISSPSPSIPSESLNYDEIPLQDCIEDLRVFVDVRPNLKYFEVYGLRLKNLKNLVLSEFRAIFGHNGMHSDVSSYYGNNITFSKYAESRVSFMPGYGYDDLERGLQEYQRCDKHIRLESLRNYSVFSKLTYFLNDCDLPNLIHFQDDLTASSISGLRCCKFEKLEVLDITFFTFPVLEDCTFDLLKELILKVEVPFIKKVPYSSFRFSNLLENSFAFCKGLQVPKLEMVSVPNIGMLVNLHLSFNTIVNIKTIELADIVGLADMLRIHKSSIKQEALVRILEDPIIKKDDSKRRYSIVKMTPVCAAHRGGVFPGDFIDSSIPDSLLQGSEGSSESLNNNIDDDDQRDIVWNTLFGTFASDETYSLTPTQLQFVDIPLIKNILEQFNLLLSKKKPQSSELTENTTLGARMKQYSGIEWAPYFEIDISSDAANNGASKWYIYSLHSV